MRTKDSIMASDKTKATTSVSEGNQNVSKGGKNSNAVNKPHKTTVVPPPRPKKK